MLSAAAAAAAGAGEKRASRGCCYCYCRRFRRRWQETSSGNAPVRPRCYRFAGLTGVVAKPNFSVVVVGVVVVGGGEGVAAAVGGGGLWSCVFGGCSC